MTSHELSLYVKSKYLNNDKYSKLITQQHINDNPDIIELYISGNKHITHIHNLTNLKTLVANNYPALTIIENTSITKLEIIATNNITDISKLVNLKILNASCSNIQKLPNSIVDINLKFNNNIVDLSDLKNLEIADLSSSSVSNICLNKIKVLNISNNINYINTFENALNLKSLNISGTCKVSTINNHNIEKLRLSSNKFIKFLSIKNLVMLVARNNCVLENIDCPNLKILIMDNNIYLSKIPSINKLVYFIATGNTKLKKISGNYIKYIDISENISTNIVLNKVPLIETIVSRGISNLNFINNIKINKLDIRNNIHFSHNGPLLVKDIKLGNISDSQTKNLRRLTNKYWNAVFNESDKINANEYNNLFLN